MRVTVDQDVPSEFQLLKTYFNMKALAGRVECARISSGGEGYHFIVRGLPISFETSLILRRLLGDDVVRIGFDEEPSGKPRQVLYSKRGTREVTPLDEKNILALPFFLKTKPRKWYR